LFKIQRHTINKVAPSRLQVLNHWRPLVEKIMQLL